MLASRTAFPVPGMPNLKRGGWYTTAAGMRAGRPTVICPFFGDQPFWGNQVVRFGGGLKLSSQKRLKAEELADAISKVTTDIEIQEAATFLGKKIQSEDGVLNAINTIGNISNALGNNGPHMHFSVRMNSLY